MIRNITILLLLSLSYTADHLLLIQVVTQPDSAESFSIYNPTDSPIDLTNYYICDDEEYYKMQTEGDMAPSSSISGFTARFPSILINSGETLHIILNSDYSGFYGEEFTPDIIMYGDENNSMLETEPGSIGFSAGKLDETSELLILFYWDGNSEFLIEDVDYFLWGAYQTPINKTGISTYQDDTPIESQLFFETEAETYYAYSRIEVDEIDETQTGGNGITGHDETSENFRESWEIIELFNLGCMDSEAPNYDPFAEFDDGSCLVSFEAIINGDFDCESSSAYYCDNTTVCPFLNIQGLIVNYFDVTPFGGPHSITLEDPTLYQIELTIWPSEWDIVNDSLAFILSPPYNQILIQASGGIFDYNGNKIMRICSSDNILIVDFLGCTDPEATNYNSNATVDDGSCYYCDLGDVNCDGELNVLDIVSLVNIIMDDGEYTEYGDVNEDGYLNILDVVTLVNWVLYGNDGACVDIDGNVYETVQIGEQLWMAENLKVTHYNDGSEIPTDYSNSEWAELQTGAYAVYNNDPSNADTYGNLYNWFAVDDERGLCMDGWHVPSDVEFMELEMFLGMSEEEANSSGWRGTNEGSKLAGNTDLWSNGNLENNSEFGSSGFSAFPAGYRFSNSGYYIGMGIDGYFWSSSESSSTNAWYRLLSYYYSDVSRYNLNKLVGFSIRCLGD